MYIHTLFIYNSGLCEYAKFNCNIYIVSCIDENIPCIFREAEYIFTLNKINNQETPRQILNLYFTKLKLSGLTRRVSLPITHYVAEDGLGLLFFCLDHLSPGITHKLVPPCWDYVILKVK